MIRLPALAIAVLLLLVQSALQPATGRLATSPATPRFVEGRCDWQAPEGETEGTDFTCGYLWTPMLHSDPSSREIGLAVMILHATGATPAPDPIIWNTGGPGASAIDDYGASLATSRLRIDRDIVLFDQRGSGHSIPALACPDVDTAEEGTTWDEAYYRRIGDALLSCARAYRAQDIDMAAFGPLESAMDVEDLRLALGYQQVNLYGVSYGSLITQEALRRFSPAIRSVVLDGTFPTGTDPLIKAEVLAIDKVFTACYARPDCASMYPQLRQEYDAVIDRLNNPPPAAQQGDPGTDVPSEDGLTSSQFEGTLHTLLYVEGTVPYVPLIVHAAFTEDYAPLNYVFSQLEIGDDTAGAYWAAYCEIAASAGSKTDQALACAEYLKASLESLGPQQQDRGSQPSQVLPEPVTSDVPVLLLSGEFDPITPTTYAYQVARTLSNSTIVVLPGSGHALYGSNECADDVMESFLHSPGSALDLGCVEAIPALEFKSPLQLAELYAVDDPPPGYEIPYFFYGLRIGGFQTLHNAIAITIGGLWLLLLFGGVLLLLLGPAQCLTLLRRGPPATRPPIIARLVPLWSLAYLIGVTASLTYLAAAIWGYLTVPDVTPYLRLLRLLPLLVVALCVLNSAGTFSGIRSGAWPAWRRILHGLVAIPIIGLTFALVLLTAIAAWV
jgi:pimeloyl-ACP methyl ester carboxylesterase